VTAEDITILKFMFYLRENFPSIVVVLNEKGQLQLASILGDCYNRREVNFIIKGSAFPVNSLHRR
jgi:hypothetical protein